MFSPQEKKRYLYEVIDVVTNIIVVIVLQICIYQIMYIWSNKMSYVNYILIKWGKGKKGVIRIQ